MELLYCKVSAKRKRAFQIKTKIIKDGKSVVVLKEPLNNMAKDHITGMKNKQLELKKIYGDFCIDYKLTEQGIVCPFYNCDSSLSNKLIKALNSEDEKKIEEYIAFLRHVITGNTDNICKFSVTDDFIRVFGNKYSNESAEAVRIANFDLQPDNILFLIDGSVKIIDYEWVFIFPMPVDFILYYSLRTFANFYNLTNKLHKLLYVANINEKEIDMYEEMINEFYKYVSVDENGIDYRKMGCQFVDASYDVEAYLESLKYKFPQYKIPEGSSLVLYGAGNVGRDYYTYITKTNKYHLSGWLDKRANVLRLKNDDIMPVESIKKMHYDYILISVMYKEIADEIKNELIGMGVDEQKILWERPKYN